MPAWRRPGFQAPGVVVGYTDDPEIRAAASSSARACRPPPRVPLQCDEPEGFSSFRIGLFGLEKLQHVDRTVQHLGPGAGRFGAAGHAASGLMLPNDRRPAIEKTTAG